MWTSLAGALGVGTYSMSSVRSCRRAGRQPRTCHLYPAPLPGLPVDAGAHLSVKGGLIFQGNCLANHTLKVIVGFLSALSLHVAQKASVGETELRKLTLIMCHHGQPITGRWERIAYFFPVLQSCKYRCYNNPWSYYKPFRSNFLDHAEPFFQSATFLFPGFRIFVQQM